MRGDGTLRDFWHPKSGERRAESERGGVAERGPGSSESREETQTEAQGRGEKTVQ